MGETAKSEAPKIIEFLKDEDSNVRSVAAEALEKGAPFDQGSAIQLLLLNPIHEDLRRRSELRFLCHFISGGNETVRIWLRYVGKPAEPKEALDRTTYENYLRVLLEAWEASKGWSASLKDIREELAKAMAALAGRVTGEEGEDEPNLPTSLKFLFALRKEFELLRIGTLLKDTHSALSQADEEEIRILATHVDKEISELNSRLLIAKYSERVFAVVVIHGCFWIALIFFYPRWSWVQAIFFWNPWVRRILGFPYVGLLLTWVPFLRRRLLSPFRESLVRREVLEGFDPQLWYPNSQVRNVKTEYSEDLSQAIPSLTGQIVLQGASGLGKTMFLKQMLSKAPSTRISVFLKAEDCSKSQGSEGSGNNREVFGAVIEAISDRLFGYAQDRTFLQKLIYSGALDIYIDGLNEVSAEIRAEITHFLNRYFKGNIILTTQPLLKWNPPGVAGVYELLPLEKDQIQAFLHSREGALPEVASKKGKDYTDACTAYLNKTLSGADTSFDSEEIQTEVQSVLSNPMDLTRLLDVFNGTCEV